MERPEHKGKGSKDDSANCQFWCNPRWISYDSIACMEKFLECGSSGDRAVSSTTSTLESSPQIA